MIKVWDYKKEYENIREDVLDAVDSVFRGGTLVFGPVSQFSNVSLGCQNNNPNTLKTDYCISIVKKDVREFTDIHVTAEVMELSENNAENKFVIHDLDRGTVLFRISFEDEDGPVYTGTFSIASETRIGVRIISDNTIKYKIVSEYGETILNETIKNNGVL